QLGDNQLAGPGPVNPVIRISFFDIFLYSVNGFLSGPVKACTKAHHQNRLFGILHCSCLLAIAFLLSALFILLLSAFWSVFPCLFLFLSPFGGVQAARAFSVEMEISPTTARSSAWYA